MSIRVLPKVLVDKIAAGEVIERPASVVKELVENSIDAGARRITVELEDGGSKLIRVVDDGCGMDESDVALAFLSHATSKLVTEDDLFNILTMGFRGEALSSIASVSHARIVSRRADSDAGCEVSAEGGAVGGVKACGAAPGTQVEVRNLFYNVPVRRKFLKSHATEMAHVSEAVTRVALAHPGIAFVLTHNGRKVFNLAPAQDGAQRLGEFFGRQIADNLIPLHERFPTVEIEGWLLPPTVDRGNTTMQYTYVNRRYIRERTLMHAIGEAYQGVMTPRRRPVCFLFLTVDPHDVDVNVHPCKIEIKFRHVRDIHSHVLNALRETLRRAKLTPQVSLSPATAPPAPAGQRTEATRAAIADFFAGRRAPERPTGSARSRGMAEAAAPARPESGPHPGPLPAGEGSARGGFVPPEPAPADRAPVPLPEVHYGNTVQVLDAYIVEEAPAGIRITDQHALHERILFEHMQQRIAEGPLASQRLLVPDLVELSKPEFFAVMELRDDLGRFGMEIEAFGESTVIVRSFPQALGRFDGQSFFRELLDEMEGPEGVRRVDGRLERLLKIMACRGAVKAGERLSPRQIRSLMDQRATVTDAGTCPHGRPTSILITRQELEKHFRRT